MNKDQVKGSLKEAAGKVQAKVGQVVGSTDQQVKGHAKEVEGRVQKVIGDVEATVEDLTKKP